MIIFKFISVELKVRVFKFLFKCQNRKNKIKNITKIIFWFNSGGSFEPPGLQVELPHVKSRSIPYVGGQANKQTQ